jgi:hypothetical protein
MPRKLRIQYEGAIYHVMNRGDRREDIFHGDSDRHLFLQTLGEACARTGWQIHAFTGRFAIQTMAWPVVEFVDEGGSLLGATHHLRL